MLSHDSAGNFVGGAQPVPRLRTDGPWPWEGRSARMPNRFGPQSQLRFRRDAPRRDVGRFLAQYDLAVPYREIGLSAVLTCIGLTSKQAAVVMLRALYPGMTQAEAGAAMGTSQQAVGRLWADANKRLILRGLGPLPAWRSKQPIEVPWQESYEVAA
jgi:hypothetical protein